jgi:hypothetical protein
MKRSKAHSRAITAIEVLVATMLASLMLGSVVGVLGGLARQERILRKRALTTPAWHVHLADQLQWDLTNSREFVASETGVTLLGFASRDFATHQPISRPAEVTYYLIEAMGDRWLVRREAHRDERMNDSVRMELVCRGVDRFQFGPVLVNQPSSTGQIPTVKTANPLATPMTERVAIQLYERSADTPSFDRVFLKH